MLSEGFTSKLIDRTPELTLPQLNELFHFVYCEPESNPHNQGIDQLFATQFEEAWSYLAGPAMNLKVQEVVEEDFGGTIAPELVTGALVALVNATSAKRGYNPQDHIWDVLVS
jgi:hypothetical protein